LGVVFTKFKNYKIRTLAYLFKTFGENKRGSLKALLKTETEYGYEKKIFIYLKIRNNSKDWVEKFKDSSYSKRKNEYFRRY
jgi:hypothetical protein